MSVKDKMTALADEIRGKTGGEELLTIDKMREYIQKVYDAGIEWEHNEFWNVYQNNGSKTTYNYAFAYWDKNIFTPQYNIIPLTMSGIFYGFNSNNVEALDLKKRLLDLGVMLDFSKISGVTSYAFWSANISILPELDFRTATGFEGTFSRSKIQEIEKLMLNQKGSQSFSNTFSYCTDLKELNVVGSIGNDFDIHWSPLSKDSILSIFNALLDTAIGKTISFSLSAVNKAFEDTESAGNSSTSDEWKTLLNTKPNWTVTLM